MAKLTKRKKQILETIDLKKVYDLSDAIAALKSMPPLKFDETVEVSMNLNVDPRHSDQMVRGMVGLPNGTGKNVRVAVFAKDEKLEEAKAAGADIAGSDELIEQIQAGKIDFDRCIATPDMMGFVGRVAKILGPKGLMPNPKLGTVTLDVAEAVKSAKAGQVQFRVEKAGVIHAGIGKLSFSATDIEVNAKAFFDAVSKAKPSGAKGTYIESISMSTTMGPGLKISLASVLDI